MRRLVLILPLLLTSCPQPAQPNTWRQTSDISTELLGVRILYQFMNGHKFRSPDTLAEAQGVPGSPFCVVTFYTGKQTTRTAAHEFAHCYAYWKGLSGRPRPDLGEHYNSPAEGFAQAYALEYMRLCGDTPRALGWPVGDSATCQTLPNPEEVNR